MVDKRPPAQTRKRLAKVLQDDYWDCSVCTYRNSPEAFKCSVCDVRKGTSTRKPRLNQQIVAQQEATRLVAQNEIKLPPVMQKKTKEEAEKDPGIPGTTDWTKRRRRKKSRCHLKGLDRASADTFKITVNESTVTVVEFKPKKAK